MFNFQGKIILVTGAAGSLGSALVKAYLKAGGIVLAVDHRKGRLAGTFNSNAFEGKVHFYEGVDLTDRGSVLKMAKDVQDQVGLVDIIVNTVGGFTSGDPVHELSLETLQKMIALNLVTFLNTSAGFVPHLLKKGGGKVVTVGSRAGLSGGARTSAYAAAKGALLRMTESMAAELKAKNIQVNCVLPSTIDTPANRQAMPNADFSKWVGPEKIAQTILFLTSSGADDINGAALPVYGLS
jgi:NAD(P)-dependent dehydrogenase (short-subunit alcohol dehydrogenase family)